jgi:hypothetical protein
MSLSLDRKAFIDILAEGRGSARAVMQPPPAGVWGMPPELLQTLPGYGPDVGKSRAEGRSIMEKLGYGPNKPLKVTVSTRNLAPYRDPAVILIDQLKEVYIDAEHSAASCDRVTDDRHDCTAFDDFGHVCRRPSNKGVALAVGISSGRSHDQRRGMINRR